mmetsp:Transcript_85195/g.245935  ORF Transcript_85195/g.245935 Transcript_85195/m.245935 type:complete len:317 (+) Transcript_85195:862-1812(+)
MLGALALIPVRQEQHEAGLLQPFVLPRGNELVDHHLRGVGEIAELRLPDDQRIWVLVSVAQLEAKHSILGQDGVPSNECFLWAQAQVVQETVSVVSLLVPDDAVSVREGPTLHILACDPHVVALEQQAAPGQRLSRGPIDLLALVEVLALLLQLPLEPAVQGEALRGFAEFVADGLQKRGLQACGVALPFVGGLGETLPFRGDPFHCLAMVAVGGLEGFLVGGPDRGLNLRKLPLRGDAGVDELLREDGLGPRVRGDLLVQLRLRVVGVQGLVVAKAPVTDHVDDDVRTPSLPPLGSELEHGHNGRRIVPVAMKDG